MKSSFRVSMWVLAAVVGFAMGQPIQAQQSVQREPVTTGELDHLDATYNDLLGNYNKRISIIYYGSAAEQIMNQNARPAVIVYNRDPAGQVLMFRTINYHQITGGYNRQFQEWEAIVELGPMQFGTPSATPTPTPTPVPTPVPSPRPSPDEIVYRGLLDQGGWAIELKLNFSSGKPVVSGGKISTLTALPDGKNAQDSYEIIGLPDGGEYLFATAGSKFRGTFSSSEAASAPSSLDVYLTSDTNKVRITVSR